MNDYTLGNYHILKSRVSNVIVFVKVYYTVVNQQNLITSSQTLQKSEAAATILLTTALR